MKIQKHVIAALVATGIIFLLDYLWYMVLMADFFSEMPGQKAMPDFVWLVLGLFIYSLALVYFYDKGQKGGEERMAYSLHFAIWTTLLVWLSMTFIWYSLMDGMSMTEGLVDTVYRFVQTVIVGIAVAMVTGRPMGKRGKSGSGGDG
jgi:hypothetical protein